MEFDLLLVKINHAHYDNKNKCFYHKGTDSMIKILNGIHETVAYNSMNGLNLYHNREAEDYPIHWHTPLEIIMPVEGIYTVVIDDVPHTFKEGIFGSLLPALFTN